MPNSTRSSRRWPRPVLEYLAGDVEAQWRSAGETDAYVFEELVALYEAKGDGPRAARYRSLLEQARP